MNRIRMLTRSALVLGCISLLWVVYNLPSYHRISAGIPQEELIGAGQEMIILFGLLALFLFHIVALTALVMQFYYERKAGLPRAAALFIGPISMFMVFGDWAAMNDIYTQTMAGMESGGEWNLLYIGTTLHLVFLLLSLAVNVGFLRRLNTGKLEFEQASRDETLFLSAQYFGIASGVLGLGMIGLVYGLAAPDWYNVPLGVLVVLSVVILAPYGLIVACWLAAKYRERPVQWYDEKQFTDISRSGFITLLFSLPCMAALYALGNAGIMINLNVLWFFIYIFLVLGVFSGGTLYFSTRQ